MDEGQSLEELIAQLSNRFYTLFVDDRVVIFGSEDQLLATVAVILTQAARHIVANEIQILPLLLPIHKT